MKVHMTESPELDIEISTTYVADFFNNFPEFD